MSAGRAAKAPLTADAGGSPALAAPARTARWKAASRHAPVVVVAAAMTYYGLWGLARSWAMGNDEVVSRWAALLSLPQLGHLLAHIDVVHGLYYLLLHAWMAVGTSPLVMRIPSVAAMVGAAVMMVILARRLTGSGWTGLFAGLVMTLTPVISYYAQTARSYALVFACVLGQTLALVSALHAERTGAAWRQVRRWWLVYGGLVTLGAYLNEMALLVLAAHAITVYLARYGRQAARHWAITSAVSAGLVTPLLALSVQQHSALSWLARPGLQQVWVLYHDYFGATSVSALLVAACTVIGVLPSGRWWRPRRSTAPRPGATPGAGNGAVPGAGNGAVPGAGNALPWWRSGGVSLPSVAVPLLVVPAGLLLIESAAVPLYQDRYVLYGEAGAALLAGAGMYRIGRWLAAAVRRPELVALPGLALCAGTLLLQLHAEQRTRTPVSRQFNFGGPSFYVGDHARRGDGVLFLNSFFRKAELGYPGEFRSTRDFTLAVPPVTAAPYQGIDKPFTVIRPLLLGYRRIWVIGYRPSPHLRWQVSRDESLVLLHDFTRATKRDYKGIHVTLWVRR